VWRPRRCILLPYIAGSYTPPANAGLQQPAAGRRLMQVPSRGTSLPPAVAAVAPAGGAAGNTPIVMTQSAAAANNSNNTCQAVPPGVTTAAGVGGHPVAQVEVVEDGAAWVAFEGRWGARETPSPISQKWFKAAEPPVSRTLMRRILHFPAEQQLGQKGC
jgi:hypothetical protein